MKNEYGLSLCKEIWNEGLYPKLNYKPINALLMPFALLGDVLDNVASIPLAKEIIKIQKKSKKNKLEALSNE